MEDIALWLQQGMGVVVAVLAHIAAAEGGLTAKPSSSLNP